MLAIKDIASVNEVYQNMHETLPDAVRLRVHRSLSWLKQAQLCQEDDLKFMCLWVAFNAAYAKDVKSETATADRSMFQEFLSLICSVDNEEIYRLVWKTYPQSIRILLDSKYVFQPFWKFHNGLKSEAAWKEEFEDAKKKSNRALENQDTSTVLLVVFERLYTLRNQIFHGGATFTSKVNRSQVKDAIRILSDLLPVFLLIMMSKPKEGLWGQPYYPLVKS